MRIELETADVLEPPSIYGTKYANPLSQADVLISYDVYMMLTKLELQLEGDKNEN